MNQAKILPAARFESAMLMGLAVIPLCLFAWMTIGHFKETSFFDLKEKNQTSIQKAGLLAQNMRPWDQMTWDEKESAVAMAIEFFRETANTAILKSSQHYVLLINSLFREKPEAKEQNIFVVLQALAIQEYDFLNGVNADEQARKLLGPELFERNKEFQKARETKFLRR